MRALFFNGKRLEERAAPRPRRGRGDALVRVRAAGICGTDLEILRGYMSFRGIPGHEFVGTVEAATTKRLVGKRVVGEINVHCGRCPLCAAGLGKHCPRRSVLGISGRNGAFADYLVLPERNLHVVPPGLSDEEAVFTELVAAACEIPERLAIRRRDRIVVLGDGRLAAMAAQVLATFSRKVLVLGVNGRKLAAIAELGIETREARRRHGLLHRQDVVVECTGSPEGLPLAAELARPRGVIVLKSTFHGPVAWNPTPIAVDEITVVGSRCGPFDKALLLMRSGAVRTLPFLTAAYPFEEWRRAFRRARRADSFKVLVRME